MNTILSFKENLQNQLAPKIRPWLEKALDKWETLNNREQLIVSLLGLTVVLALFTVLIVHPMLQAREQAETIYESRAKLLSWMQSVAPQVQGSGGEVVNQLNAQSMMNTVNQNAAAYQLRLDRVQPESGNSLRVWIQEAPFNEMMQWLNDLQTKQGIAATSVSIDSESKPGIVSVRLVLEGQ